MPRIPEAQFRTDPSVRVGNQSGGRIQAPDTKSIRKLGGQFVDIANKMETAEETSKALTLVTEIDDLFSKDVEARKEYIEKNSVNGRTITDDPKGQRMISKEFGEISDKFQARVSSLLEDDNHIAKKAYTRYVLPRLQKAQNEIKIAEATQINDFTLKQDTAAQNAIVEKRNAGASKEELNSLIKEYGYRLTATASILGEKATAEQYINMEHKIALSGGEYVTRNSPNTAAEIAAVKSAKEWADKLPEAQKIAMYGKIDSAAARTRLARIEKTRADIKTLSSHAHNPQAIKENIADWKKTAESIFTEPRTSLESKDARADSMGMLIGSQMAALAALEVPKANIEQFDNFIDTQINNFLKKGIGNTNLAKKDVGVEKIKQSIKRHAKNSIGAFKAKLQSDGATTYTQVENSAYPNELLSGESQRQSMAVSGNVKYQKDAGKADEDITIVTDEMTDTFTKEWKNAHDTSGGARLQFIENLKLQGGQFAHRIAREAIAKGRGKGLPPITLIALRVSDKNMVGEMMSDYNNYSNNLNIIQDKIGGNIVKFDSVKKVESNIAAKFVSDGFDGLYQGRKGENMHLYTGMKQAIMGRTIGLIANMNLSEDEAYDQAKADFNSEFLLGKGGGSTILLDKKFIQKFRPEQKDVDSAAKDLKSLKHFNRTGTKIDFAALEKLAGKSSILGKYSAISGDASKANIKDGYDIAHEMFIRKMDEDDIMVAPHKDKPNVSVFYINPKNHAPIPIPMVTFSGETDDLVMDMDEFYPAKVTQDMEDRARFKKHIETVGARGRVEIVPKDKK